MRKSSASSWRSGLVRIWAIASMTILACSTAFAQTEEWPAKANVKLIVPFAAGGSADALARVLANQLQQNLSRTFFVENIPGGSGVAAMQASARSAPDGYTLVLAGLGSHILAPLFAGKGAETMADYTTISMIGGPPSVLVTHPSFPVADLAAFVVKAKELNEGLSWASSGLGTSSYLVGELFLQANKIKNSHVPYRGAAPAINDLLNGQLPAAFVNLTSVAPHIKVGSLRPLAVTSNKRLSDFPDVPNFSEAGFDKLLDTSAWYGITGPRGMADDLVLRVDREVKRALDAESMQKVLEREYIPVQNWDPATFARFFQEQFDQWTPVVQSIKAQKGN